jgi:sugar lactone lactonase YvrE
MMRICMAALASSILATYAMAGDAPPLMAAWGSYGSGPGEFRQPLDVAVAASGNIYVADSDNRRIQYFTPEGVPLGIWATATELCPEGFSTVQGIAIDAVDNVYVSDMQACIRKYSATGQFVASFQDPHLGGANRGIALDNVGNIYVATLRSQYPFRRHVIKLDPTGVFLMSFEAPSAHGVCVDNHGCVFVTSESSNEPISVIERYAPTGELMAQSVIGGECGPLFGYDVVGDNNGNVIVADGGFKNIQVFSHELACIGAWTPPPPPPPLDTFGTAPVGLALDASGHLFVTDTAGDRVLKFEYVGPVPAHGTTWGRMKAVYR